MFCSFAFWVLRGVAGIRRYSKPRRPRTSRSAWMCHALPVPKGLVCLSRHHLQHVVRPCVVCSALCRTRCSCWTPTLVYVCVCVCVCGGDVLTWVSCCLATWSAAKERDLAQALHRVLHCVAVVDPELGYSQGMNFLAQTLVKEVRVWGWRCRVHPECNTCVSVWSLGCFRGSRWAVVT